MKKTVAVFDFDGTLSSGECGPRFFRYLLGNKQFSQLLLRNFGWGLLYLLKLGDEIALNKIISSVFKDKKVEDVIPIAHSFAEQIMPKHLYKQTLQRLTWHQAQGHRCIIITRALDIYMKPWAKQFAIDDMIATELEVSAEGFFTGKIVNHSYVGKRKLQALFQLLGDLNDYTVYAYGDSASDKYILAAADYAYFIRKPNVDLDKALLANKTLNKWY